MADDKKIDVEALEATLRAHALEIASLKVLVASLIGEVAAGSGQSAEEANAHMDSMRAFAHQIVDESTFEIANYSGDESSAAEDIRELVDDTLDALAFGDHDGDAAN